MIARPAFAPWYELGHVSVMGQWRCVWLANFHLISASRELDAVAGCQDVAVDTGNAPVQLVHSFFSSPTFDPGVGTTPFVQVGLLQDTGIQIVQQMLEMVVLDIVIKKSPGLYSHLFHVEKVTQSW